MSDALIFAMGKYEARIPTDRGYTENHHWLQAFEDRFRVGLTAYSVRLLQDIYFLDWSIDPQTSVKRKQEVGEVESSKAVSAMYAPADGEILVFNEAILQDPSAINADMYGSGWLYEMKSDAPLLTAEEYLALLERTWDDTQRMIKKQVH